MTYVRIPTAPIDLADLSPIEWTLIGRNIPVYTTVMGVTANLLGWEYWITNPAPHQAVCIYRDRHRIVTTRWRNPETGSLDLVARALPGRGKRGMLA